MLCRRDGTISSLSLSRSDTSSRLLSADTNTLKIAKHLQKDDTQFAVVDIGKSYDLVQRLEIDGWNRGAPSLHLFQGVGHRTEYRGALRETE